MDLLDPQVEPEDVRTTDDRVRHRRAGGRRSRHQARSRRHVRRRRIRGVLARARALVRPLLLLLGSAGLVLALVALIAVTTGPDAPRSEVTDVAAAPVVPAAGQDTLLLVRTADGGVARSITLLAPAGDGSAAILFIPSSVLVELPGIGLDRLGQAHLYGGAALTEAAVENALGIEVDASATVTQAGLASLLQRVGGATVSVEERLVDRAADGTGTIAFEVGEQYLNGARLADYWAFETRSGTELDGFPRQQQVLDALWAAVAQPQVRDGVFDPTRPPQELMTSASGEEIATVISGVADAAAAGSLSYHLLPVIPFGTADESLDASYQIVADDAADLVQRILGPSIPDGGGADAATIQVLNGVGRPGVGRSVDEALTGLPVRIVLTENARSFDFTDTRVIIYDETAASRAIAAQVREAMGVGRILVSRQPQSVVDITIVVGADFFDGPQSATTGF